MGDWLVQPSLNVLTHAGVVRHLEPQVMDLLAFLAHAGRRVVSKDEIIDAVWHGRFIAAPCSQAWIGPKVAWSFVAMADPDFTEPMFAEISQHRLRDAAAPAVPRS